MVDVVDAGGLVVLVVVGCAVVVVVAFTVVVDFGGAVVGAAVVGAAVVGAAVAGTVVGVVVLVLVVVVASIAPDEASRSTWAGAHSLHAGPDQSLTPSSLVNGGRMLPATSTTSPTSLKL